jgi:DNA-binding IclR family transcriptional regulator
VGLHIMDETPVRRTIAQVESTLPLRRTYTDLGAPIPPHQGAPGKLLLAFAPEELREKVLAQDLRSATTHARIRPEDLRAELDLVRERGYAASMEERVAGVAGIAAPVRDHAGGVVAALSVSIPAVRTDRHALEKLAPRMAEAAMELSHQLGYRSGEPAA